MNDAGLKSLYRRLGAGGNGPVLEAEVLLQPLSRPGYPDIEDTLLDRIAASTPDADLLRTLQALECDAAQLEREVAALRAPRRSRPARRWMALAAGIGAAAVLVLALRGSPQPAAGLAAPTPAADDVIFSVSFERTADASAAGGEDSPPIFSGGFDS